MRSAPGPTLEGRGRGRGGGARAGNGRGFPAVEGGTRVFYRFYRAPRGRVDTPRRREEAADSLRGDGVRRDCPRHTGSQDAEQIDERTLSLCTQLSGTFPA